MRLAVCEAPPVMLAGDAGWIRLVDEVKAASPDILLLNEMPFGSWVSIGESRQVDQLLESQLRHSEGLARLRDLNTPTVLGSYPAFEKTRSINKAFLWSAVSGCKPVHTKQHFPNEPGFYEARWFERGDTRFGIADAGGIGVGFLICTDVMFNEWARYYGRNGAHLIAVPRATPVGSEHRWRTMCAAAAIVSGCYVASSNRCGMDDSGLEFAGRGWIIDPVGEVVAETSPETPVVTADMDLSLVTSAQADYPCYVEELD